MLLEHALFQVIRIERQFEGPCRKFMLKRRQRAAGMGGLLATRAVVDPEFSLSIYRDVRQSVIGISLSTLFNRSMLLSGLESSLSQSEHSTEAGKHKYLSPCSLYLLHQGQGDLVAADTGECDRILCAKSMSVEFFVRVGDEVILWHSPRKLTGHRYIPTHLALRIRE